MKLEHVLNVRDMRELARRRLPRMIFDLIDGGAEDEVTMRANEAAFSHIEFRPRTPRRRVETLAVDFGGGTPRRGAVRPGAGGGYAGWQEAADLMVARFRAERGKHPGNQRASKLIEMLSAESPAFSQRWVRAEIKQLSGRP